MRGKAGLIAKSQKLVIYFNSMYGYFSTGNFYFLFMLIVIKKVV